ncbi:UNVERIFIED_CONTAM: hypothetical protein HDU68_007243 [Siphonaria sp. JEL0065]|nr:hypothetical protein HDU68_007243 [Siphonaria sp. JEL0065]
MPLPSPPYTSPPSYSSPPYVDVAYPQVSVTPAVDQDTRLQAFRSIVARHEISNFMALKMRKLEQYEIIVIADDSWSMQEKTNIGISRWEELKETVTIVTEIGSVLDEDGVDIYFLNRPPVRNIKGSVDQMNSAFAPPPRGLTPIARVLRQVLREKGLPLNENSKKLLILIATDGNPTTDQGSLDKAGLYNVLMTERGNPYNVPVVFLACTDDEEQIGYLNEWDKVIPCLDVVDDYFSERREILAVQGNGFAFSRGDWVCKMLLGAIDPEIDALDERRFVQPAVVQPIRSSTLAVPGSGRRMERSLSSTSARSTRSNNGGKDCVIQ